MFSFFLSCPQELGEGSASFAVLAVSGRGPTFLVSCCFLFLSSVPRCLPVASMPVCWSAGLDACLLVSMPACGLDACLLACWSRCLPVASMPVCWLAGLDACLWPRCLSAGLLASMPACGFDACLLACWPRCLPAGLDACLWRAWSNGIIRRDFFCLISFLYIVFLFFGFLVEVLLFRC